MYKSVATLTSLETQMCSYKLFLCYSNSCQKERDHLENQGIEGMVGSEWIIGRLAAGV
jgi:hypothetical protein